MDSKKIRKTYIGYGYHGGGRKPTGLTRDKMLSVRLSQSELTKFKEAVKKSGLSQSDFIMQLILEK